MTADGAFRPGHRSRKAAAEKSQVMRDYLRNQEREDEPLVQMNLFR